MENQYESEFMDSQNENLTQKRYVTTLIKSRPGLGDYALKIADDLTNTGLSPTEAIMLIDMVYCPQDLEGKGQGNKLKHFSEAVVQRYGGDYLEKVSRSPELFRGLLHQIGQAVDMRDDTNGSLSHSSISFKDSLLFQELGLSAEVLDGYIYNLTVDQGLSEVAAIMRIKEAAAQVEKGRFATLEGILFREEFSSMTTMRMEDDREYE